MSRLRIAMLAPISWRVPPRHYGPWEWVTSLLTEGLVARGVDVTLFATEDSQTIGKLHSICPRPYSEDQDLDCAWSVGGLGCPAYTMAGSITAQLPNRSRNILHFMTKV